MTVFQSILLGIIQGLAEFLPISSSGHLVFVEHFLKINPEANVGFNVILHLGTVLAIILVYWKDLAGLAQGGVLGWQHSSHRNELQNLGLLVLASVPTAIIGLLFKDTFEAMFGSPKIVAGMLCVTGTFLLASRWAQKGTREMGWRQALVTGTIQGMAIIPGISRSGSTICAGLFQGVDRNAAGRFSFLLSVPAVLGAAVLEGRHLMSTPILPLPIAIGFLTSFVVGYFSLRFLIAFIRQGKLHWFGYYCLPLGIIGLIIF